MFRADRLRKLREERGFSQSDLARFLQIPHSTIAVWETGKATPALEKIVKIAKFFDVSIEYLLGLTDDPKPIKKVLEEYPWFPHIRPLPIFNGADVGPLGIDETTPKAGWIGVPTNVEGHYGVVVPDDDMSPLVRKGDVVIVGGAEVKSGDLAVVIIDSRLTLRKVVQMAGEGKHLLLTESLEHPPIIVPGAFYVQFLGRVTYIFKKFAGANRREAR